MDIVLTSNDALTQTIANISPKFHRIAHCVSAIQQGIDSHTALKASQDPMSDTMIIPDPTTTLAKLFAETGAMVDQLGADLSERDQFLLHINESEKAPQALPA